MTCDETRWLLCLEPQSPAPQSPYLRRHLARCPGCQAYWQALAAVDDALAALPLAGPGMDLVGDVMRAVERRPRRAQVAPPFSRAFYLFGAAVALVALAAGGLLLHHCSLAAPWSGTRLSPAWPGDASAWLSLRAEVVGQVVLAAMAGLFITVVGVAVGLRAGDEGPHGREVSPLADKPSGNRAP